MHEDQKKSNSAWKTGIIIAFFSSLFIALLVLFGDYIGLSKLKAGVSGLFNFEAEFSDENKQVPDSNSVILPPEPSLPSKNRVEKEPKPEKIAVVVQTPHIQLKDGKVTVKDKDKRITKDYHIINRIGRNIEIEIATGTYHIEIESLAKDKICIGKIYPNTQICACDYP